MRPAVKYQTCRAMSNRSNSDASTWRSARMRRGRFASLRTRGMSPQTAAMIARAVQWDGEQKEKGTVSPPKKKNDSMGRRLPPDGLARCRLVPILRKSPKTFLAFHLLHAIMEHAFA